MAKEQAPPASEDRLPGEPIDWAVWMKGLGRNSRRARELLGLTQEQLGRVAGVSQGAISRFEAGSGMATPLLVVMRIRHALQRLVMSLGPETASPELTQLISKDDRLAEATAKGDAIPLLRDPALETLIRLYRAIPERKQEHFLQLVEAAAIALAPHDGLGDVSPAPRAARPPSGE